MFYTQVLTCLYNRQVTPCMSSTGQRSPTRALIAATLLARRLERRLCWQRTADGRHGVVAFRAKSPDAASYTATEVIVTMARCNSKWRRVMSNGTTYERSWKLHILMIE